MKQSDSRSRVIGIALSDRLRSGLMIAILATAFAGCGGGSDRSDTQADSGETASGDNSVNSGEESSDTSAPENDGSVGGDSNTGGSNGQVPPNTEPPGNDFSNAITVKAGQPFEFGLSNSISPDTYPRVVFREIDGQGQAVRSLESVGYAFSADRVWIVAPGPLDLQPTGAVGNYVIAVEGAANTERVKIADYPSFSVLQPGAVFVGQLRASANAIVRSNAALVRMHEQQKITTSERDRALAANDRQMLTLAGMIAQYERSGTVTINDEITGGIAATLANSTLGRMDRALLARWAAQHTLVEQSALAVNTQVQTKYAREVDWGPWTEAMQASVEAVGGEDYTDLTFGVWDAIKRGGRQARRGAAFVGLQISSAGSAAAAIAYSQAVAALTYIGDKITNAIDRGDQSEFDRLQELAKSTIANFVSVLRSLPDHSTVAPMIQSLDDWLSAYGLMERIDGLCQVNPQQGLSSSAQLKQTTETCPLVPTGPSTQFRPDFSQIWSSTYGDIYWRQGYYGNTTKTIARGTGQWDAVNGVYVMEGRWGRTTSSYAGGWRFTFQSDCSFSGVWWRDTNTTQEFGWTGNCN